MKTRLTSFFLILCVAFLISAVTNQSSAQVNVTMKLNTATCLDTLQPGDFVQVRGESVQGTTPAITWDNATGINLTSLGGDYWETTFQAMPGDTIRFKFWTGFALDPEDGTAHWDGWEGDMIAAGGLSGTNRALVVGTQDTLLPLQYYNGENGPVDQYWMPFVSKPDSVAIYFRVNVGGVAFDPEAQTVDVMGGLPLGGATDWTTIVTLTREVNSVNGGSFHSGVVYLPVDSVVPGTTEQQWKFVIQPDAIWEGTPPGNRSFTFSSTNDTTILWYYFNDRAPSGPAVTANLLFRLKLDALEDAGMFNRALGDRVGITGPKGWASDPVEFDDYPTVIPLTYAPDFEEMQVNESFTKYPNEMIPYKYYIDWDTSRVDPNSPNYIPGLALTNGWEEPGVTGGADRSYTYTDQTQQYLTGDFGYEQQFFNSIPPEGVIPNNIDVTFNIDMAGAADPNANPNILFRPGMDTAFIQFDGSLVPVTQGLPMYGVENYLKLNDLDGDGIYSATWSLTGPTFYQLCFLIAYTAESGDTISNGGGTLSGRRYYQFVHPESVAPVVWPSSFNLPVLQWMNDSLTVENPPDLILSAEGEEIIPTRYSISQNYPNPFNPATKVQYYLPVRSSVKLNIYDITGRLVKTLSNKEESAGTHIVSWNSTDNFGNSVASGIYFLRISAGDYRNTIKMMLLK